MQEEFETQWGNMQSIMEQDIHFYGNQRFTQIHNELRYYCKCSARYKMQLKTIWTEYWTLDIFSINLTKSKYTLLWDAHCAGLHFKHLANARSNVISMLNFKLNIDNRFHVTVKVYLFHYVRPPDNVFYL